MHFLSSIWEGMGICETRLGHFDAARALLDKAKRACVKPPAHAAAEGGEVEYEAAAASVFVALSELHSAQGDHDAAVDCLEQARAIQEPRPCPAAPAASSCCRTAAARLARPCAGGVPCPERAPARASWSRALSQF